MSKMTKLFASVATLLPVAFNNKGGWKIEDGKIVTDASGDPIYVKDDGSEQSLSPATISRLNAEAKTNREAKETLEAKYKPFEGLDADAARKAIDALSKIDQKTLIDAGEVDRVKKEISDAYEGRIAEVTATNTKLLGDLDNMKLSSAFTGSKFIADNIAVPREMFEATFRDRFKIEEGKIVPYDHTGSKIYSKKNMGEVAGVDEALSILVDNYAHKDSILKAPGGTGGTGGNGGGGQRGAGRTMRRADFDALPPSDQAAAATAAGKGELTIAD